MVELVGDLKAAMAARIEKHDWMSPATKTAALEKLAKINVKIGYPDKWRDYSRAEDRRRRPLRQRRARRTRFECRRISSQTWASRSTARSGA